MLFNRIKNRLMIVLFRLPWVRERWIRRFNPVEADGIPWTPLSKPLSRCRFSLITTGGVHLITDKPFDMGDKFGDPSFRRIPSKTARDDLMITHDYYDHRDADRDLNIVFPIDILHKYREEELVGSVSDFLYSFMGHIDGPHVKTLVEVTAVSVARELKLQGVDAVILVPA